MDRLPDHLKGLVITTLGVLVLTPDSLLVRLIQIDPWTMVFWRGLLMFLAIGGFTLAYYRGEAPARLRATGRAGLAAIALFGTGTVLFVLALYNTSVANVLVIVAAAPLIAAVYSRLFLAEPVALRTWAAIAAAIAGIAVLASDSARGGTILGDLAALGTAASVGIGFSVVRHARPRNMVPAMAVSGLVSALVALPLAAPASVPGDQIWLLLVLGVVVLPVSFGLLTLGPRYITAPEVGLIMLLETVLGPLWVWLVLTEEPSAHALVGGAIVIVALVGHSLAGLRAHRGRRRAAAATSA